MILPGRKLRNTRMAIWQSLWRENDPDGRNLAILKPDGRLGVNNRRQRVDKRYVIRHKTDGINLNSD